MLLSAISPPSLPGFPLQSLPALAHLPSSRWPRFTTKGLYPSVIRLLCLSLSVWQSAESRAKDKAECL